MSERWRFKLRITTILALLLVFHHSLSLCWSLNSEGMALLKFREGVVNDPFGALLNWNNEGGDVDPCSWFGVECSDGKVIILNLKNLCLEGTLAPELGKLTYIKFIALRNNSFLGKIPVEIAELEELEVLDLGYNNLSGSFPSDLGNNLSLSVLLLDNNKLLGSTSPELDKIAMLSELQVDENQLTTAASEASCSSRCSAWNTERDGNVAQRRSLKGLEPSPSTSKSSPSPSTSKSSPSPSPSPSTSSQSPSKSSSPFIVSPSLSSPSSSPVSPPSLAPSALPKPNPPPHVKPRGHHPPPLPSNASTPSQTAPQNSRSTNHTIITLPVIIGGSLFIVFSILGIMVCRSSKVVTIKPWATGLSGQLQKAFVTGVPNLRRSELETACEDFSNVIGSLSDGTVYKGTLSSGVEIAVTSTAVKSAEDWTKKLEAQFRKKIDTLSKVNHKNFVNLIGFCKEEEPFTRMMVFEYAPNGSLYEHLHIKEAEHLNWRTRLRIAMGMAYCLEHMHHLDPPIAHKNLHSKSIYLSEDYAAKISDFSFWNDGNTSRMGPAATKLLETPSAGPQCNVYSFGVILFEMITGKLPYALDNNCPRGWASDYLNWGKPLPQMVDPTLESFREDELEKISEVIKDCVQPDPRQRPTMTEVTARLKEITAMEPEGATPKVSPLWWAELEIMTSETS